MVSLKILVGFGDACKTKNFEKIDEILTQHLVVMTDRQICLVINILWVDNYNDVLEYLKEKYKINIYNPFLYGYETRNLSEY